MSSCSLGERIGPRMAQSRYQCVIKLHSSSTRRMPSTDTDHLELRANDEWPTDNRRQPSKFGRHSTKYLTKPLLLPGAKRFRVRGLSPECARQRRAARPNSPTRTVQSRTKCPTMRLYLSEEVRLDCYSSRPTKRVSLVDYSNYPRCSSHARLVDHLLYGYLSL